MIGLGIAGLGRATVTFLSSLLAHPGIRIVGAAEVSENKRRRFAADFRAPAVADVEALCQLPGVDAVYIATPHQLHAANACTAAAAGKHVLVEKPMALSLPDCLTMIEATAAAGVALIVGPTHGMDPQALALRDLVASGDYGRLRMISSWNYTDYLYKPRRPEELETSLGGGMVFNQLPQQVDLIRTIGGSARPSWVRAVLGAWDPARGTEGACAGLIGFHEDWVASLVYSGYAHFDSDELCGWVTESGQPKASDDYGRARLALRAATTAAAECALREARGYGVAETPQFLASMQPTANDRLPHFGVTIVSCDSADFRITGDGVAIYGDDRRQTVGVRRGSGGGPKALALDELIGAIDGTAVPIHDGRWGMQTLEVCLAMLRSSQEDIEVALSSTTTP